MFNDTYYGARILTECFLDFFGQTLLEQIELNNKIGWPQAEQNYATCVLMYLTMFRSVRASDVVASHAYPSLSMNPNDSVARSRTWTVAIPDSRNPPRRLDRDGE
ncbi:MULTISPECIES: hypothetical protein [Bradyrhizobium]|uniref:hypothetical protein n=1 Tax=Bradyrhizobium brasilense TaxID=1419277 RepID=UPI002877D5E9|nr:hypothetical protein [Bradyrhizobium brasilense]MCP3415730.1 hypothetical protein [Bradyrhizobium brasilense]